MHRIGRSFQAFLTLAFIASVALANKPPLSANDVSWLFPLPTKTADLNNLISVRELIGRNSKGAGKGEPVWSDAVFKQFVAIAASPAAQVDGTEARIGLPVEAQSIDAWFVAGVRIDAGAPGLSADVIREYGQSPQIRLIVQPLVRNADGTVKVLDVAGHLIFSFLAGQDPPAQDGCFPRPKPDMAAFKAVVADLAELRTKFSKMGGGRIATDGLPLGVHPGLADAATATAVRLEMKAFLEKHLSSRNLNAMAMMSVPAGAKAPWIFLAMQGVPAGVVPALPNGGFVPVPSPTLDGKQIAQMLNPAGKVPRVVPAPHTNNLNAITCKNAAVSLTSLPVDARSGNSTSDLFGDPPGQTKAKPVLDLIADPTKSHFFNTDCVSCHTETRRAMDLLPLNDIDVVAAINPAALSNGDWNVRNFGWSPEAPARATVTRRTAAETAAVVAFINSELLNK